MISVDTEVLVAGAGPTGLTLACDLLRRGVACRIVDAAPGPQEGSRAFGIKPRTLAVLDALGAAAPVVREASAGAGLRVYLGTGPLFTRRGTVREPTPAEPYPNAVSLPEWRTEAVLRARLADLGGKVEFGARLTGLNQDGDAATAVLTTSAGEERVRAAYVIGCDGGGSTVRGLAGIAFTGRTDEDARALLADVEVRGLTPPGAVHLWLGERSMVAVRPTPGATTSQVVASLDPGEDPEVSLDALRRVVAARTGRDDLAYGAVTWLSTWRYNLRLAERYRSGRVFLAGDAAHVHSPFGAFGMNTGVQDAYNLGWKLALRLRGHAGDGLLDTYEAERLPVGRAVLAASDSSFGAFTTPPRFLRPVIPYLIRPFLARADRRGRDDHPRYPAGPLTAAPRARARVRPGDTAPDGTLAGPDGRPVRLYDLYRDPAFTLLSFGAPAPVATRHRPYVRAHAVAADGLHDPGGAVRGRFGVRHGTAVLIRPDGYVALVARPDEVDTYLDDVLT
ncbi:MAG TPA: FAD-dependent monooxygenase [Streptosporangiaceae bacterium]